MYLFIWLCWVLDVVHKIFLCPVGSLDVVPGLNCPTACGILVPQPGIEPTSPTLQGGFLTTGPPGKFLS